ncbi:MAG: tRNA dihydrouridine synthase DusB [Termitinemataceae bacterium]|nr:MAG: tRNA dihydrouridine synthase DusB [Termitinemataceae bacterium]
MCENILHPLQIGSLELDGNLFLAPVAGYSDAAFRSICIESGADFTFTELISSEALIRGGVKTTFLLARAENEKRYAIQLFGADPAVMYKAALAIEPFSPSMIDLNAGCPVPKVTKQGAGSALMRKPSLLYSIVYSLKKAAAECLSGIPVSVKIRSGWDISSLNYVECARAAIDAGAQMITLHSRTKSQGYEGNSNADHIADLVQRVSVPVTASGDMWSAEDACRILTTTGCAAVMFARGAMGNPWIFRQTKDLLKNGSYTKVSDSQKIDLAMRQLELLCKFLGEKSACLEMRKIFCAYTKGMEGGAALRSKLVHCNTINDYKSVLRTELPCAQ